MKKEKRSFFAFWAGLFLGFAGLVFACGPAQTDPQFWQPQAGGETPPGLVAGEARVNSSSYDYTSNQPPTPANRVVLSIGKDEEEPLRHTLALLPNPDNKNHFNKNQIIPLPVGEKISVQADAYAQEKNVASHKQTLDIPKENFTIFRINVTYRNYRHVHQRWNLYLSPTQMRAGNEFQKDKLRVLFSSSLEQKQIRQMLDYYQIDKFETSRFLEGFYLLQLPSKKSVPRAYLELYRTPGVEAVALVAP